MFLELICPEKSPITYKPGKSLVRSDCAAYVVAYIHTPVSMLSIHCIRTPSVGDGAARGLEGTEREGEMVKISRVLHCKSR